jgi:hypothetical protein
MRQFTTIAANAFMELIRQSIFLILMATSAAFIVFLSSVYYFGFGDDPKLVKDSTLAVMLLVGLFGAVISAAASVAHELRSGTALAVLAKPVDRIQFLLAKFLGVAVALALITCTNLLSALLSSRMAFDAYGSPDNLGLAIFYGAMLLAFALAGLTNYFLNRPFTSDAVLSMVGMITLAFLVINCFNKDGEWQKFGTGVDWRLLPAAILILFALWVLAALAIACATRFEMIPTLAICTGVFLLGLMSDYLFGRRAAPAWETLTSRQELADPKWLPHQRALLEETLDRYDTNKNGQIDFAELQAIRPDDKERMLAAGLGGARWASVLYTIVPNWQAFWLADALEAKKSIPWSYAGKAFAYMLCVLGALLALALALFEDRELS